MLVSTPLAGPFPCVRERLLEHKEQEPGEADAQAKATTLPTSFFAFD
jgi:hypothetical protein